MARIRTIKPEFPQSESMGRVSREARLLFLLLFTVVDDAGRARAASRMLASLLYPYDDDVPDLIDGWLMELEREESIQRYQVKRTSYLQICNWLMHQKIDHPSASRLPPPPDDIAKPREDSRSLAPDLGPRIMDQEAALAKTSDSEKSDLLDHWPAWEQIAKAIGAETDDPNWFGQHGRVAQWLANGWSLDLDILPTIQRVTAKRAGKSHIRRLEFFEGAIADAHASRLAPVPTGTPEKSHGKPAQRSPIMAAIDKRIERIREERAARGVDENPPRLLSEG